jgi:site-specific recombinase XerD
MTTNYQVLFYLKKPKTWIKGPIPIYLRITVAGVQKETSVGRKCDPECWSSEFHRVSGKSENVRLLNAYLDSLERKVEESHTQMSKNREEITAETLRDHFNGVEQKKPMVVELFTRHNKRIEELVGTEYEKETLKTYNTSLGHIRQFVRSFYKKEDVGIDLLDYIFISEFEHYLKTKGGIQPISAKKYITHLKSVVNTQCVLTKLLPGNPFLQYKNKAKANIRQFLDKAELTKLENKVIKVERVERVRDIFLFCCYTGLSYADISKLRRAEIGTGVGSGKWIFTNRKKTTTNTNVPLIAPAMALIEKYRGHPMCGETVFPVMSNQRMNSYLKEVADICGITKNLTFHLSRHTFATTVTLTNGVPIESVSKMLGHTNIKTTQLYAKIVDVKVSADMNKLKRKYK